MGAHSRLARHSSGGDGPNAWSAVAAERNYGLGPRNRGKHLMLGWGRPMSPPGGLPILYMGGPSPVGFLEVVFEHPGVKRRRFRMWAAH